MDVVRGACRVAGRTGRRPSGCAWLARALLGGLLVALLACGPSAGARPTAAAPPAASADQSAEWQQTVAAAKREGAVTVAGPPQPAEREAILRFREAYPDIALEYVGLLGQDYLHRVETERANGIYSWDIFIGGVSTQYDYIPKGYFQPIKPAIILPEVRDDRYWLGGFDAGYTDVGKQYVYAFTQYVTTLLKVNRTLVPESELSSAAGLFDPRWRGKIVIYDPRSGGAGLLAITALRQEFGDDAVHTLLVDQQPVFSTDKRQFTEWVVRGRYPIGIGVVDPYLAPFWEEGLAKDVKTLESGIKVVTPGSGGLVVMDNAPHPNAAKVFVNWLLGRDAQAAWAKLAATNSRRADVEPGSPDALPDPTRPGDYADYNTEVGNPTMRDTQRFSMSVIP